MHFTTTTKIITTFAQEIQEKKFIKQFRLYIQHLIFKIQKKLLL
jgi:hypothetical protein